MCESNQITCRAKVNGFALPDATKGALTSTIGVMNLIESLNHLPIECAVPVGTSTVLIQNTLGFPLSVYVETQIRDLKLQRKLIALLRRIQDKGGKDSALCELVDRLRDKIEDAGVNDRAILLHLKELANTVVQTLVQHGKCVELYERKGEYRLHTEGCDTKGVTSSATETLFGVSLGTAIPFVRLYQWGLFEKSKKWTTPEHYEAIRIAYTQSLSGYYDRVKFRLLFNDEELLKSWHARIDGLLASRRSRSRSQPAHFLKSVFAA